MHRHTDTHTDKYLSLHRSYKSELRKAKQDYYRKEIHIFRTSNPRIWHKALKKVMCGDDEKDVIEIESVKNFLDAEQVGGC